MSTYRVTFTDGSTEDVPAERADVEDRHVVLRRTVLVIGRPREVVVRRFAGAAVARVDELG
jgi:hypothetical protein